MNSRTNIARLHYITQDVDGASHAELALKACLGGVKWVQLRVKNTSFNEWMKIAKDVQDICRRFNAVFIVNDRVDIALALKADGVHLGKNDTSLPEARKILGDNVIIGGSANTREDVLRLNGCGADYIGIGPLRHTATKQNLNPVLGTETLSSIASFSTVPAIAIGGIKTDDVKPLLSKGVHGIAVSSAINLAEEKETAALAFLREINNAVPESRHSKN